MSHPLVSLGPGAGYRTHIVAESDAKHQPEALAGLRVVSEIAAARLADDEQRRRTEAPYPDHDGQLSEGNGQDDRRESKRDGDSTRRLGRPAKPRPRRRWHTPRCDPKMATTRTLGTVAGIPGSRRRHRDAFRHQHPQRLGSLSGQSASNATPGRAYSDHPARSSVPLTKPEPRTQTTLCTRIHHSFPLYGDALP